MGPAGCNDLEQEEENDVYEYKSSMMVFSSKFRKKNKQSKAKMNQVAP